MSYAMERDSRRGRDEWRGCHTFNNIICDGDEATGRRPPRSGGMKMGHTYYYYYELDGTTETHDPAVPSTTACPYLPGQRVNTLWVPTEKGSRQRSASASSARRYEYQTTNPADRFVNPRPPPQPSLLSSATSSAAQPSEDTTAPAPFPMPRRLRPQASSRSLSPASSKTAWLPRRLFLRRRTPSAQGLQEMYAVGDEDVGRHNGLPPQQSAVAQLLVASASSLSLSLPMPSHRHHAAAPSVCSRSSAASSQAGSGGSRSRDISPDSLRRFLVEDVPVDSADAAAAEEASISVASPEADDEAGDDDEHNFAVSATSESAPFTVLSPPPPPRSVTPSSLRAMTPSPMMETVVETIETVEEVEPIDTAFPIPPTRVPPSVPVVTLAAADAGADTTRPVLLRNGNEGDEGDDCDDYESASQIDVPQLELPHLSLHSCSSHGLRSSSSMSMSQETDDEDDEFFDCGDFLPPPPSPSRAHGGLASSPCKSSSEHEDLVAALDGSTFPHAASTATLVPGGNLDELVDELGWMATAIQR